MKASFVSLALALVAAGPAQALQISSFTPQGEVSRVRQVVASFDQAAVNFGDPKAPAPLTLRCDDAQAGQGTGRWTGEKRWVWDFANDLPPGVRCTASVLPGFKSTTGAAIEGRQRFDFHTGGPFIRSHWPSYGAIDEQQMFVLRLNGPATPDSVRQNVWCAADGAGERIPVKLVEGEERAALLKSRGYEAASKKEPLSFVTLQCNRTLTAGGRLQLVYGKGVATPSGVANTVERRLDFEVRQPFAIEFSCERENAQAACLPLKPMRLSFNAPVTRKMAAQIVAKGGGKSIQPRFDDDNADDDTVVNGLMLPAPFPEQTEFSIELPRNFTDASGRMLGEPDTFPLKTGTGQMPPLAKFAAAPFGVIERLAEPDGVALMHVTVRRVEPQLQVHALVPGQVKDLQPKTDAEIIDWMRKVQRYEDRYTVRRDEARRDSHVQLPPVIERSERDYVQSRMVTLLGQQPGARVLDMPQTGTDPRPFEVVGIPLTPGFHVLEIASRKLGDALLDERYGDGRTMYVRTTALATNLAVHFKLGRENAMAWVTTLDKGLPVTGAKVRLSACDGREIVTATTDARGIAALPGVNPEPPRCPQAEGDYSEPAYFVSARATDAQGVEDLAFTWSHWQRGIEPWRFNVPTSLERNPDEVAHTVFDRMLLRAGETVSMKHYVRTLTGEGFGVPRQAPDELVITHVGSGQEFKQPLVWRANPSGIENAISSFAIPAAAKLGVYQVELRRASAGRGADRESTRSFSTGQFRVEEFRLPVLEGRIAPREKQGLVAVRSVPTDVQVNYVSGGGAANLPVRVSALVRPKSLEFADFDSFSFGAPRRDGDSDVATGDGEETASAAQDTRVVADKLPLTLDRNGAGQIEIKDVPLATQTPRELLLEASYSDPNGEIQTLRSVQTLWPASVIAGLKTEGWVSTDRKLKFQALALDLAGKALPGAKLEVKAIARITTTSRKRMVGGFYTYDNKTETRELGSLCAGQSDSRGLLLCEAQLKEAGQVELVATATDGEGRSSQSASTVWVTRQGELWFGGEDHDRIDVLPEKKSYEPGEMAQFQVRSPFRFATALVAVEREGIIDTQVVQLNGQDPTVRLTVKPEWGPNVYVSVLALRGRLREVPWYSFFTWGWKAPREWWQAFWVEGREYVAPTAMVDLSKPAYRFGMAEIRVGAAAHKLDVKVSTDQPSYTVRGKAKVTITGLLPDGKPAAGAEVALAAVDQALLELMPNTSWNLLDAMLQRRSWGVSTSTAQMEIVGRRHYGKKAVPAGGGGGKAPARELLDTLLLWNPDIVLDAQGRATVEVPLNDALTTFRIVAVADIGTGFFGTGQATIATTQDLQIISGLPPLVREDDQFRAQITLRNTTGQAMKVAVTPRATLMQIPAQTVDIPAGEARDVFWDLTAPANMAQTRSQALMWEIEAKDTLGGAQDALKVTQRVVPAVPLTVQQATLVQVGGDAPFSLDVAPPAGALLPAGEPGAAPRGGLRMSLQPRLAEGLPGVRDWFANYPYSCLEQQTSKAIGLRDEKMWQGVVARMPAYLDSDGLASYFPPRGGDESRGSDTLTAYLLAASHEAAGIHPAFALPDAVRAPMESGLIAFVEGRIQRKFWSPRQDLDARKLAALEALSRYGKATGRMTTSLTVAPNQWPTSAVIDWINILRRVKDVPQREQRLAEADSVLKARLSYQGTKLIFSTEQGDYWWWLMASGDVNTARLLLTVMEDPAWKDDIGRLASGFIARQQNGAWHTTTANLWGGLALERFSRVHESTPVAGFTTATLRNAAAATAAAGSDKPASAVVDWSRVERIQATDPEGTQHGRSLFGAPASPGQFRNNGMFLPWPAGTGKNTLEVVQNGSGKPWLTLQSLAAVPLTQPFAAGYAVKKTVTPVEQAQAGKYTRGDVLRVALEINASTDMTWVALTDPVPGGATILGSGLGRDSQIATQGERQAQGAGWLAYEERSFEAFRAYYEYLPKGVTKVEYTVRLNNVGDFALPPTRAEALYAPEIFGETPNARMKVQAP
ncbi:alpha-2-macroglobulin [Xenophilus sp. Marseille-Q4582]|uniref:alpha-2-macroglobulin family protein n=1 Tax=Xenophilus sp. Marseille-Q4582 TaxID=2866600 RepID=UPI001CE3CB3F|nr:MG2 domain-containing protein [Xenophilus sp. Marseille-Q4582]